MPEMENTTVNTTNEKQYSEKEIQSMIDKRVSQALATQKQKMEEAQRLAAMSAEDRFNEQLNARQKELDDREAKINRLENEASASKELETMGLPLDFVAFVVTGTNDTAENMKARMDLLKEHFTKAVEAEITKRIGGTAPAAAGPSTAKVDFSKMSLAEMTQLYNTDKTIFERT